MTGDPIILSDELSLWTVQEALKTLARLGLVTMQTVGRAGLHSINDEHYAIEPLRKLVSPMSVLTEIIRDVIDDDVKAVIVFGSVGRGQPGPDSDIDLAVIAAKGWDDRARIQDTVHARLGNACDVVAFTPAAGDGIHAGISTNNAIVTVLTGALRLGNRLDQAVISPAQECRPGR